MRVSSEWLEGYKKKNHTRRSDKARKADDSWLAVVVKVSVHAAALAALIKKTDLLEGNQEHYDQVRVFDCMERKHPDLYVRLHSTPNGGHRGKKSASMIQAEGQKKGYPDMSLDKAAGVYHGMRVELKHGKRKPTKEQIEWLNALTDEGYYCVLAFTPEEAVAAMVAYSQLKPGESMPAHANDSYWRVSTET
ncbi:norphogenetic protein [Citrobacter sp. NCU1]|uniref:VRR-NUC domain-containing protein n=1 Tax=Citrobacter sp. NCU1 TaxID=2026683 RepID=UPI0013919582|nr:VRR-NUC domain-containing protein [Citrobacter sp. NCU1]NDO81526.1 norphogenetic protein [Citrobacter sp. NCU1]